MEDLLVVDVACSEGNMARLLVTVYRRMKTVTAGPVRWPLVAQARVARRRLRSRYHDMPTSYRCEEGGLTTVSLEGSLLN